MSEMQEAKRGVEERILKYNEIPGYNKSKSLPDGEDEIP